MAMLPEERLRDIAEKSGTHFVKRHRASVLHKQCLCGFLHWNLGCLLHVRPGYATQGDRLKAIG